MLPYICGTSKGQPFPELTQAIQNNPDLAKKAATGAISYAKENPEARNAAINYAKENPDVAMQAAGAASGGSDNPFGGNAV